MPAEASLFAKTHHGVRRAVATQRLYKFAVIEGGRGQVDSGVDSEKEPSGQMERKSA